MQRRTLAVVAVGVVMLSAGCGFLLGLNSLTFSASPVNASDQAVQESGYGETLDGPRTESRNYTAFGQTRTVEVTNYVAKYERTLDLGPVGSQRAGLVVAFASPEIEVAGNTLNPIQGVSEDELISRVGSQYENISAIEPSGSRTVEALGANRTLDRFDGTATIAGSEVPISLEIARFKHGSDYLVLVAVYPQAAAGEPARVATVVESLDHPDDTTTEA